jgi:hypothetical protein
MAGRKRVMVALGFNLQFQDQPFGMREAVAEGVEATQQEG